MGVTMVKKELIVESKLIVTVDKIDLVVNHLEVIRTIHLKELGMEEEKQDLQNEKVQEIALTTEKASMKASPVFSPTDTIDQIRGSTLQAQAMTPEVVLEVIAAVAMIEITETEEVTEEATVGVLMEETIIHRAGRQIIRRGDLVQEIKAIIEIKRGKEIGKWI